MYTLRSCTTTLSILFLLAMGTAHADTTAIAIGSIEELQRIGNEDAYPLNGYYVLTSDIDASPTAYWNSGSGFAPIGQRLEKDDSLAFNGWFDGQGYVIYGLVINRPDMQGVGLFGSIGGNAVVVNLGLEGGSITGNHYTGSLVGENWSTEIASCYADTAVNGTTRIGGLVGINRGVLDNCHAVGTVQGNEYVGGLVGRNYEGIVQNCYSTAEVIGIYWTGGLIGETFAGEIFNSFWDIENSGVTVSGGGEGLTTEAIARL